MIVSIHQPNFWPWLGYFDKIRRSDLFLIMDDVQLTDSSMTQRNRVLNSNGVASYITVPFMKEGYMVKTIRELEINRSIDWQKRHMDFLKGTYGKTPYWQEVSTLIEPIYTKEYDKLVDVNIDILHLMCQLLEIDTKMLRQSDMTYDSTKRKDELVLELCKSAGATTYLSGRGAKKYMDEEIFKNCGIGVEYQEYTCPEYKQIYSDEFISGLSILDVLLNNGIEETKRLFLCAE